MDAWERIVRGRLRRSLRVEGRADAVVVWMARGVTARARASYNAKDHGIGPQERAQRNHACVMQDDASNEPLASPDRRARNLRTM
jgi:hypothetical protein